MKIPAFLLLSLFAFFRPANAQETERIIQKGNELYKQQQYDKAEAAYNEVLEKEKNNTTAAFNRGIALYRQSKQDDAVKVMDDVIMNAGAADNELKGKAYYNKGVVLTGQHKLEESIEAYKNALRQNPGDKEARENLQKALLELKKKTPPPPPKQNKKKQPQPQQPKMNQKEAEQKLKLLEQKEKEVQQRLQNEKSKTGVPQPKDW